MLVPTHQKCQQAFLKNDASLPKCRTEQSWKDFSLGGYLCVGFMAIPMPMLPQSLSVSESGACHQTHG